MCLPCFEKGDCSTLKLHDNYEFTMEFIWPLNHEMLDFHTTFATDWPMLDKNTIKITVLVFPPYLWFFHIKYLIIIDPTRKQ